MTIAVLIERGFVSSHSQVRSNPTLTRFSTDTGSPQLSHVSSVMCRHPHDAPLYPTLKVAGVVEKGESGPFYEACKSRSYNYTTHWVKSYRQE